MKESKHTTEYIPPAEREYLLERLYDLCNGNTEDLLASLSTELLEQLSLFGIAKVFFDYSPDNETKFFREIAAAVAYLKRQKRADDSHFQLGTYFAQEKPSERFFSQVLTKEHFITRWWRQAEETQGDHVLSDSALWAGNAQRIQSRQYPLLSDIPLRPGEEAAQTQLARLKEDGRISPRDSTEYQIGEHAALVLILANLRLVRLRAQITTQFIPGMDESIFPDLVQAGIMGLMRSIDSYRPEGGASVATYASFAINQYIRTELATQLDLLSVAPEKVTRAFSLNAAIRTYTQQHGEEPDERTLMQLARIDATKPGAHKKLAVLMADCELIMRSRRVLDIAQVLNEGTEMVDTVIVMETVRAMISDPGERFIFTRMAGLPDSEPITFAELERQCATDAAPESVRCLPRAVLERRFHNLQTRLSRLLEQDRR